jgi:spore coat protein JB
MYNMEVTESKRDLLRKIQECNFSVVECALYLDTHPDDKKAIGMHREYCKELKELNDKYQKLYGPLSINYPSDKWRWLEGPWPWERGAN